MPAPDAAVLELDVSLDATVWISVAYEFVLGYIFTKPGEQFTDEFLEAAVLGPVMLSNGAEVDGGDGHKASLPSRPRRFLPATVSCLRGRSLAMHLANALARLVEVAGEGYRHGSQPGWLSLLSDCQS